MQQSFLCDRRRGVRGKVSIAVLVLSAAGVEHLGTHLAEESGLPFESRAAAAT